MEILKIILIAIILMAIIFAGLGIKLFFNRKPTISGTCGASQNTDASGNISCGCGSASSCQSTSN